MKHEFIMQMEILHFFIGVITMILRTTIESYSLRCLVGAFMSGICIMNEFCKCLTYHKLRPTMQAKLSIYLPRFPYTISTDYWNP